ncbi:MAG: NitT/TauT family transport system ATP-binding protein [Acidobacteriota bacterium]|nr:NitT/TauT family transport system ATP-binding protein [Acidobacteriota bacterium]
MSGPEKINIEIFFFFLYNIPMISKTKRLSLHAENAMDKSVDNQVISISCLKLDFFNTRSLLSVIGNITIAIGRYEFVSVVGPSGCGKTTLLKLIGGLLNKNDRHVKIDGEIIVDGTSPESAKKNRLFGFAFQNPVLLPWRTVRDNVVLPCELIGIDKAIAEKRASHLLDLMEIGAFESSYPHQLSGGMQQRVNIARTLIHEPSILLMDEPFGALDELTRERLNDALLNIHNIKKTTILFVTHNLAEAIYLSDRVVILSNRPSSIYSILEIDLPKNRSEEIKTSSKYVQLLGRLRQLMSSANRRDE